MNAELILRSVMLGVGLAMDAFSVSIADGLSEPGMKRNRRLVIAGTFAFFQFAMPLAGWLLVREAVTLFSALRPMIPSTALFLLAYIGGKMLAEGIRESRARRNRAAADHSAGSPAELPDGSTSGSVDRSEDEPMGIYADEAISGSAAGHVPGSEAGTAGRGKLPDSDASKVLTAGVLLVQAIATSIDALSVGLTISDYTVSSAFTSAVIIGAETMLICLCGLYFGRKIGDRMKGRASVLGGVILVAIGIEIWLRGILGM